MPSNYVSGTAHYELILLDSSNHNIGWLEQQSIIGWKWYIQDQTQASLEGIHNLQKEVAQTPGAPTSTSHILIYLSQLISCSLRGT